MYFSVSEDNQDQRHYQALDKENFNDVYIVYELMDTDLHKIIKSSQALTDDHYQVS